MGMHSVWLRYSATDTFLDDGLTLSDRGHIKDVLCLVNIFRRSTILSYWPATCTKKRKTGGKISFWKKGDHLTGKFSKFRYQRIHWHLNSHISNFLPSFMEVGKAEVTKRMRGIHHEKGWYFAPFSVASGAITPKMLQDHPFPIPHPFAKSCPNSSSFRGDKSKNVFPTHYNIGVKPSRAEVTHWWSNNSKIWGMRLLFLNVQSNFELLESSRLIE